MKFDRSKFKKTELTQIKETVESAEKTMYQRNKGYVQFVSVGDGKNIFRVLPSIQALAYAPLKISKLQVECDIYDENGNVKGKEVKAKNIFCADIHGTTLLQGKDPITTYCNYVFKKAEEEYQDVEEKKKFLAPVTGYRNKKGEFVWGINPTLNYVCYVLSSNGEIAKLQLRPQWMKRIQEISVEMSEDDTVSLDVFSGPDDGYPLCIMSGKDEKKKTTYSVSAVLPKKNQSWVEFFDENAISDEVLEELSELPSLKELYVDSYSKRDFEWALDGLERLDKSAGYNIFQNDEFLMEIEQMAVLIPEDDEVKEEEIKSSSKSTRTSSINKEKTVTSRDTVTFSKPKAAAVIEDQKKYPSLIKMKSELKEYIEQEYEGEEELPDLSIAELRGWYDLMKAGKMLPFEDYKEDESSFDEENESSSEPSPFNETAESSISNEDSKEKIRNLRARFGKKD